MDDPLRAAPPAAALQWAADAAAPGARVSAVRRLTGGITSAMHALYVEGPRDGRRRVVLRRWAGSDRAEGAGRVRREASVLELLERTEVPAPRLVAADPLGEHCGDPALLMSWVPGRLHLTPSDPAAWLGQMASMLARIHDEHLPAAPFEPWLDVGALEVPAWSSQPDLWRAAISLVEQAPPATEHCFLHRDFQQFNLLWTGDRLASVVDWVSSSLGPPSVDVAHCRLNLAILYSPERAERLRMAYESTAGRRVEPWWDVAGMLAYLPGWGSFLQRQAGRRMRADFAGMHDRVEQTLGSILART